MHCSLLSIHKVVRLIYTYVLSQMVPPVRHPLSIIINSCEIPHTIEWGYHLRKLTGTNGEGIAAGELL